MGTLLKDATTFSTSNCLPTKRLDQWNEWVSYRLPTCVVDANREFVAANRMLKFGSTLLSIVEGDAAHLSNRRNPESTGSGEYRFLLVHNRNTVARYRLQGGDILVGDDSFMLVDLDQRVSFEVENDNKYLSMLYLRESDLLSRNLEIDRAVGKKINLREGSGAVLRSFIENIWQSESIDQVLGGRLLVDMVDLALRSVLLDGPTRQSERKRRLSEIKAFVEKNLDDPRLNTNSIAQYFSLSERYVQMMFADIKTTPARFIRDLRLEKIASVLPLSNQTITDLAFEQGFGDYSQFCRDFRSRFGVSPSRFRKVGT